MAKYIQYIRFNKVTNDYEECIGGDSCFKPDQRYSKETIIQKMYDKYFARPKDAVGFVIKEGYDIYHLRDLTNILLF